VYVVADLRQSNSFHVYQDGHRRLRMLAGH
jgi:hypothetical protein